jgi:uncharacterized protein YecE (DUF72 family)
MNSKKPHSSVSESDLVPTSGIDIVSFTAQNPRMWEFRNELQELVADAAKDGVLIGTSSWKYPGWMGQLYEEQRYDYRGKFAETRFNRDCLTEYAEVFSTVCVDAGYYQFPTVEGLLKLAAQVRPEFRFSFKVTEDITVKQFPNLPRYGKRAGLINPHFLNAGLFIDAFLGPCQAIRNFMGLLIFEFSPFRGGDFHRGREFVEALDDFLGMLPAGWNYGVEIRNQTFLRAEYFETLAKHKVSHIFNSWTDMPEIAEQMAMPGSITRDDYVGARLLLKPGRKYQEAVNEFSPYASVKEPLPEVRKAAADLVLRGRKQIKPAATLIYVNNRMEGNALQTIKAILTHPRA